MLYESKISSASKENVFGGINFVESSRGVFRNQLTSARDAFVGLLIQIVYFLKICLFFSKMVFTLFISNFCSINFILFSLTQTFSFSMPFLQQILPLFIVYYLVYDIYIYIYIYICEKSTQIQPKKLIIFYLLNKFKRFTYKFTS